MDFNLERYPILNPCFPCVKICASTGTLASRYFCNNCINGTEQHGSSFAASKKAGGASAGTTSGISNGPGDICTTNDGFAGSRSIGSGAFTSPLLVPKVTIFTTLHRPDNTLFP